MPRYHISPKTGRPNICYATRRACPIGGEDNHYASKEETREAYETKMGYQTLAPVQKKVKSIDETPQSIEYKRASNIVMDELLVVSRKKSDLLDDAKNYGFDKTFKKMKKLDGLTAELKEEQGRLDEKYRKFKKEWERGNTSPLNNVKEHNDPRRIGESFDAGHGSGKYNSFFSMRSGTYNPTDRNGTGKGYIDTDRQSLVIIGKRGGKSARILSSYGEVYENPKNNLGTNISHVRQARKDNDAVDTDFRVLGYVEKHGKMHGWVPNRRLPHYVLSL